MAKSAATLTLFFAALVLFAVLETPAMVEAQQKYCEKPSGTWSGVCGDSGKCKDQCIKLEKASHGSCNYKFPAHRCVCYFPC